jgi:hypothetical protein
VDVDGRTATVYEFDPLSVDEGGSSSFTIAATSFTAAQTAASPPSSKPSISLPMPQSSRAGWSL